MLKHLQKPAVQMILLVVVVAIAGLAFWVSKQPAKAANTPPEPKEGKAPPKPPASLIAEDKTVALGEQRTATMGNAQQVDRLIVTTPKKSPPLPCCPPPPRRKRRRISRRPSPSWCM